MSSILSSVLTVLFALPVLGSVLVFLFGKVITKNSRRAVHLTLDYTTILYIISVHFLIVTILGKSLFWVIILLMIMIAMMFVFVHWKVKEEIILKKVMKGFWRFNFILFFLVYIALTFYGLISSAVTFSFST
ncbi:ABC-type multidrug transport system permease subunit [Bacillus sp. SORGH_AS 510]|uniref:DUF3397 domain-containing protein n=1 Tax=Bacillus sp. SORGH_AS_0510 TaxID=3041771 RepID=UPI00278A0C2A|nr:DUF3397 domain-containing protein [Bacillus sp. SORGH_AS_0510]MDQ1146811.1 ABC-type multidrug transport system permease subunit [Bacillus sp. SORGH_AS_0510]